MKVEVLQVTKTNNGFNIVHVRCGHLIGTCLANSDVETAGDYELKSSLKVRDGRLIPLIRVERPEAGL